MAFDRAAYWINYRKANAGKWQLKRSSIKKSAVRIKPVKPKTKMEKSIPELIKEAEKVFNAFIRYRDSEDGFFRCISCDQILPVRVMQAGHFLSAGNNSIVRLHELNVWGECEICNCFTPDHLTGYRKNLAKRIGVDAIEELEALSKRAFKWEREYLIEVIEEYRSKIRLDKAG